MQLEDLHHQTSEEDATNICSILVRDRAYVIKRPYPLQRFLMSSYSKAKVQVYETKHAQQTTVSHPCRPPNPYGGKKNTLTRFTFRSQNISTSEQFSGTTKLKIANSSIISVLATVPKGCHPNSWLFACWQKQVWEQIIIPCHPHTKTPAHFCNELIKFYYWQHNRKQAYCGLPDKVLVVIFTPLSTNHTFPAHYFLIVRSLFSLPVKRTHFSQQQTLRNSTTRILGKENITVNTTSVRDYLVSSPPVHMEMHLKK